MSLFVGLAIGACVGLGLGASIAFVVITQAMIAASRQ